jgi:hypothetical protein
MNELELRLADLGSALEWPATPDLTAGVAGRLVARPARRGVLRRSRGPRRVRALALAAVIVALVAGTAAAVAPVRHAIEDVFGLRGATVERVKVLPPLPAGAGRGLHLGRRIPVAQARHAASFRALLPAGGANAAFVSRDVAGGQIALLVGRRLVMEFRGQSFPYVYKLIGTGTRARRVRVGGDPGIYLDRASHEVFFLDAQGNGGTDTVRRAGRVLLWQHGGLILRIEGARSLADALALARSLR